MIKLISLFLCSSVLVVMFQHSENGKPKATIKHIPVKTAQAIAQKQAKPTLQAEVIGSLNRAKLNPGASHVIMDAILAANNSIERNLPIDASVCDRVGEIEQPLQPINEQDMGQQLAAAGLNAEQYQVIVDGIAEANASNPVGSH